MPIQFTCPHCGATTNVADEYAGQSGPCAACGQTISVPAAAAPRGDWTPPRRRLAPVVGLILVLLVVAGALVVCGGALSWWMLKWRTGQSTATLCTTNLKRIGLAMHNYHDAHGCFPPAYLPDRDGQPMHSWRVLLLPYLEQEGLYLQYNFDQPWNSPDNLALDALIDDVYCCPDDWQGDYSDTSYVMIVGAGAISDGPTATRLADVTDGASRTIMVVEVANSGIHWMEPRDLDAAEITFAVNDRTPQGIRSEHPGYANVLLCDGTVHAVPVGTAPAEIEAMTTIAGGEEIGDATDGY